MMRRHLIHPLALCACTLGPLVIGESAGDGSGGQEGEEDGTDAASVSVSAGADESDTTSGDTADVPPEQCTSDCAPTFAWCVGIEDPIAGIEWDASLHRLLMLSGASTGVPIVQELDLEHGWPGQPDTLYEVPDAAWNGYTFAIGPEGGVALLFEEAGGGYRLQLRPSDLAEVEWEAENPADPDLFWLPHDLAVLDDGRVRVTGQNRVDDQWSLFLAAWTADGELEWQRSWAVAETVYQVRVAAIGGAHETAVWSEYRADGGIDRMQQLDWFSATDEPLAQHRLGYETPIVHPAVPWQGGWAVLRGEGSGLSLSRFDGELSMLGVGTDGPSAPPTIAIDPKRVIAFDERLLVIVAAETQGDQALELRSFDAEGQLHHVVPFPELGTHPSHGYSIDDVAIGDGGIFLTGTGVSADDITQPFACRVDP